GYINIRDLKAFKALNIKRELSSDDKQNKIVTNLENLKSILDYPKSKRDINLYGSLRQILENLNSLEFMWHDPEANIVLSDDLNIIKNLGSSFNNSITSQTTRNIFHDKTWKESNRKLLEITEHILNTLGEKWCNPVFESSMLRCKQSERTYILDIIILLLRSSLGNLLNSSICLNTAKRQSIASKARRNARVDKERMRKKPNIMGLLKYYRKIAEFIFTECSYIICYNSKKDDNDVKL
ncbi:4176_t:CDS:2, partial [Dentiscutata heterogama]